MKKFGLLVVAVLLFAVGCGSDGTDDTNSGAPDDSVAPIAEELVPELADGEGAPLPDGSEDSQPELPPEPFCTALADYPGNSSLPFTSGPSALEPALAAAAEAALALDAMAPAAQQVDAATVASQVLLMDALAADVGYDFVIANQELLEEPPFLDPDADESLTRLQDFCSSIGGGNDTGDQPVDATVQLYLDLGLGEDAANCMATTFGDWRDDEELQLLLTDGVGGEADSMLGICDVTADQLIG